MTKNQIITALQATLVIVIGFCLIIQHAVRLSHHRLQFNPEININPYAINSGLILMIMGILLTYLGFYLYTRRKVAYVSTIILLASTLIIMIIMRHKVMVLLTIVILFFVWMILSRRYYDIRSDMVRVAFGIRISLIISIVGFTYGFIGFTVFGPVIFHHNFSLQEASIASFQTLFTFIDLDTPTRQAQLFIYSINILSLIIFVLAIGSLFKPVRFILESHRYDKEKALEIIQTNSRSSEDYFKIWPNDKHYYFSKSRQSFVAYKIGNQTAIILGDPCGVAGEFPHLISDFHEFVTSNGWAVAAINATDISESLYKDQGLKELFIGNEAVISITDYIAHTSTSKHFRYIKNRAKRDDLTVEYWDDVDDKKIQILKGVSDSWLSRGGRKEYTFFMGYFDPVYLKACSIMVLKQHEVVIAYINIVPSFTPKEASIDHLRSLPDTSPAAMHFLLAQVIEQLSIYGKDFLNIGFAPLSGLEVRDGKRPTTEKLLAILKKFGNRYYSFRGVEQFKGKFKPIWYPRHLYYSGSIASLARIIRDIEQASRRHGERSRRQKVVVGLLTFLTFAALLQLL